MPVRRGFRSAGLPAPRLSRASRASVIATSISSRANANCPASNSSERGHGLRALELLHQPLEGGHKGFLIGGFLIGEPNLDMPECRALHLECLSLYLEGLPQIRRRLGEACRINGLMHTALFPGTPQADSRPIV